MDSENRLLPPAAIVPACGAGSPSAPLRIAIVTQRVTKGDGQGHVNFEVAHAAALQGWHVTLLASDVDPELGALQNVTWIPIPWSTRCTALVAELRFAWRSGRVLRRRRPEFDIVHVNGFNTLATGDVNAAHFIHTAWMRSPAHTSRLHRGIYGRYHRLYTWLNALLERRAFRNARVVVAVSERVSRELVAIGVPAERIRVIWNGVDTQEFRPQRTQRSTLGLPESVPLALFVGNIRTPIKNLDTTLMALKRTSDTHLAVVGALPGSPYPAQAEALGLAGRVHFLGFRTDVATVMRAADFFVFPSRYEPFALVVLEAMASGLPVITVDTVGAADLLTPDCGVKLTDTEDSAALGAAMERLARSLQTRTAMGLAARAVAERHSWAAMAAAYLQLYGELASEKCTGAR